ncbi:MAG TPA: GerMN domain-containing protein [Chloroflexota bacterium]|nr:GerMN domain-containing protein [Chloroflexota bacterium]
MFFTAGGKLVPESDQINGGDALLASMQLLLKGPQTPDHFSEIPKTAQLLDVSLDNGTAVADFDAPFYASGGSTGIQLRLAQVVFTLTQFPNISAVQFRQDGQAATATGGEGFPLNRPLTRGSFSQLI